MRPKDIQTTTECGDLSRSKSGETQKNLFKNNIEAYANIVYFF